jgi:hypothetical protein
LTNDADKANLTDDVDVTNKCWLLYKHTIAMTSWGQKVGYWGKRSE